VHHDGDGEVGVLLFLDRDRGGGAVEAHQHVEAAVVGIAGHADHRDPGVHPCLGDRRHQVRAALADVADDTTVVLGAQLPQVDLAQEVRVGVQVHRCARCLGNVLGRVRRAVGGVVVFAGFRGHRGVHFRLRA
jgi:hypothetical protein